MISSNNRWLKFAYNIIMTGIPLKTYPELYVPETINIHQYNTYVNYKLTIDEWDKLNRYIYENTNVKMSIMSMEAKSNPTYDYYLSVNMYNYDNQVYNNNKNNNQAIAKCEIKTYVKDANGNYGTLILEDVSNYTSEKIKNILMGINDTCEYTINDCYQNIDSGLSDKEYQYYSSICPTCNYGNLKSYIAIKASSNIFDFMLSYNINNNDNKFNLNRNLIDYMDNIFNYNKIYKKMFYDTTITRADIRRVNNYNISFKFKDMIFTNPDSIFYFKNKGNILSYSNYL